MKKIAGIIILSLLTFSIVVGQVYKPENIPFEYDPDKLNYKLLGGVDIRAGQNVVVDVNCYDPDGDPFTIDVLNPQDGMALTNGDKWQLSWTPNNAGVFYINVEAKDIPPDPNDSLTDRGTLIFNVKPRNRPPILRPCGG
jgi:hypothetical protein